MYIQGAKIQGFKYGGITPLDYSGLSGWWRASDGISFSLGNRVFKWNDLSGNNRHFTAMSSASYSPLSSYGSLVQTSNGAGITGGDGNGGFGITHDYSFKNVFYDGSKMTFIIVFKINSLGSGGYNFIRTSTISEASGLCGSATISVPLSSGNHPIRTFNSAGSTLAINDGVSIYNPAIMPQSHVLSLVDYGYSSSSADLHRKTFLDNVVKTERKFSSAPSAGFTNTPLLFQAGSTLNTVFEIIIYDNTGKSTNQINFEKDSLYEQYILKRYPNLFI